MEDVRVCTSQRTISAFVRYYSKFVQEVNHFIEVLTNWSVTKTKKQRKLPVSGSQKWLRSLTRVVAKRVSTVLLRKTQILAVPI